jgi:L-seryl-tRNA(Ser) seleniumtransferase
MLTMTAGEIEARARSIVEQLHGTSKLTCRLVDGFSTTGGGSAPESALATRLLALTSTGVSTSTFDARLRASDPPVVARIEHDALVIDLRTVDASDDVVVANIIAEAAKSSTS